VLAVARFFYKKLFSQHRQLAHHKKKIILSEQTNFFLSQRLGFFFSQPLHPARERESFFCPGEREKSPRGGPRDDSDFSPAGGRFLPKTTFSAPRVTIPPRGAKSPPGGPAGRLINGFSGDFTHQRILGPGGKSYLDGLLFCRSKRAENPSTRIRAPRAPRGAKKVVFCPFLPFLATLPPRPRPAGLGRFCSPGPPLAHEIYRGFIEEFIGERRKIYRAAGGLL